MRPELVALGPIRLSAYPTFLGLAFVVCSLLMLRDTRRRDGLTLPPYFFLVVFLGALIGARAFHIVQYDELHNLWRALIIWAPGLVFYGGLLGGTVAGAVYLRMTGVPLMATADLAAPYLALGEAITRIGCFLNGCCWGSVSHLSWAIAFPRGSKAFLFHLESGQIPPDAPASLPVHPTQLYMVAGLLLGFFLLKLVYTKRLATFTGAVAAGYLVWYGALRFLAEFVRGDVAHAWNGMTVSQTISAGLFAAGAAALILGKVLGKRPQRG